MLKRAALSALFATIFAFVLKWAWAGILKLGENATIGWISEQVGLYFGIESPSADTVLVALVEWGPPIVAAILILALYHLVYHYKVGKRPPPDISPLPDFTTAEMVDRQIAQPRRPTRVQQGASNAIREPFASVRLLYHVEANSLTVLTKTNVRSVVITPERGWATPLTKPPHLVYVTFEDRDRFHIETTSHATVYVEVIAQGADFARMKLTQSITTGQPMSGEVHIKFYSQPPTPAGRQQDQPFALTPSTPQSEPKRLTLLELFKSDFSHTLRTDVEVTSTTSTGLQYKFISKAFHDFAAGSWFGGFYLPSTGWDAGMSYMVAESLISEHERLLKDAQSGIKLKTKAPGDSSVVDFSDLTFSRRVYIYHEDEFSLKQQADLTEAFKNKGAFLQLRGQPYVTSCWTNEVIKSKR